MKRQKVHIDAADHTYQTESDSNKKVFSQVALMPSNYIIQKEFLQIFNHSVRIHMDI